MDSNKPPRKRLKPSLSPHNEVDGTPNVNLINIVDIPEELLVGIFINLDFKTVCLCATLCKTFHKALSNHTLYKNIILQQGMSKKHMEAYISKITRPQKLSIVYKKDFPMQSFDEFMEFNHYVTLVLERCNKFLNNISIFNCRSDAMLKLVFECESLSRLSFNFCKGFNSQLRTTNLTHLHFEACDIPSSIMCQALKDNSILRSLTLVNNINLHTNGIAKAIGMYNSQIEDIRFVEKRRIRARGIEAIARCNKLKNLLLSGSPFQCDPESSLEQLAAGCPLLERLSIHGWKGLTDDKLLPILQSCTQLKYLDFRGVDVTIKSCREAALSLPLLKHMDFDKCERIKRTQLLHLQKDFPDINVVVH